MTIVKKAALAIAILSLAACSSMSGMMDGVMGGNSVKANLTGAEEVPPVSTSAKGEANFTVSKEGAVKGSVTTTGVQGTAAHIHQGARGQNGPVIVPLTKNGDTYTAPEGAKFTEAQMSAFKAGNTYVNVHSAANKGGEIRGQLRP
jgi:CHRD domain